MAERPILFSGEMVRALLEGRKTQTRRALSPRPSGHYWEGMRGHRHEVRLMATTTGLRARCAHWLGTDQDPDVEWITCPFGTAGERLWVRETWAPLGTNGRGPFVYRADVPRGERVRVDAPWRPSIHMPREAARLFLEVTEVRVQRLQDITTEDAKAEGAHCFTDIPGGHEARWSMEHPTNTGQCLGSARMAFASYVNKLDGESRRNLEREDSLWDANPWVWAVSFRRLEGSR